MGILDVAGEIVGAASNPYGLPAKEQWDLARGSFTPDGGREIVFYYEKPTSQAAKVFRLFGQGTSGEDRTQLTGLEQIQDSGGRRKAIYEYPYLDGQKVKDLGRKGETYSFNVKFWGKNYQSKLKEFVNVVVNQGKSGKLSHPVRGIIQAAAQGYEFVHRHDEFNALTIRITFIEDNTKELAQARIAAIPPNQALRGALQTLTDVQNFIGNAITTVSAALLISQGVKQSLQQRLKSVISQTSRLLGQLAATFSSDAQLQGLYAQSGNPTNSSSGSINGQILPPVYQVGFSPTDSETIQANLETFLASNQVTSQEAIYSANVARSSISTAIDEINQSFGNDGYDIMVQYRTLAVDIQAAVEACLSSQTSKIKTFKAPFTMSLRMVAWMSGLTPDRQNDIALLNPGIESVNFIEKGITVTVPTE